MEDIQTSKGKEAETSLKNFRRMYNPEWTNTEKLAELIWAETQGLRILHEEFAKPLFTYSTEEQVILMEDEIKLVSKQREV